MGRIHPNAVSISYSVIVGIRRVAINSLFQLPLWQEHAEQVILDFTWQLGPSGPPEESCFLVRSAIAEENPNAEERNRRGVELGWDPNCHHQVFFKTW